MKQQGKQKQKQIQSKVMNIEPIHCINRTIHDTITKTDQMANRTRMQISRSLTLSSFHHITFEYDSEIKECDHAYILIGNKIKDTDIVTLGN